MGEEAGYPLSTMKVAKIETFRGLLGIAVSESS